MSSTNRGAQREPDDFYETPAWATRAILPHLPWHSPSSTVVLDPFAGRGAILDVVHRTQRANLYGIELDPGRAEACARLAEVMTGDAFAPQGWAPALSFSPITQWTIITNPPYSRAQEAVERGLVEIGAEGTMAMLLRLPWLASQKRAPLHRAHPADLFVLPRRPSFTGKGTDSADYAWFVWGPGRGGRWSILDVEAA
jgi:hypothetical protein